MDSNLLSVIVLSVVEFTCYCIILYSMVVYYKFIFIRQMSLSSQGWSMLLLIIFTLQVVIPVLFSSLSVVLWNQLWSDNNKL